LDPDKKVGGYQITLPNPAGGILDRLRCRLIAALLEALTNSALDL
jgi:hypothetical protein